MTRQSIRVNTFIKNTDSIKDPYIDGISKAFIMCEFPLALNRLPILWKIKTLYVSLSVLYCVALMVVLVNSLYGIVYTQLLQVFLVIFFIIQYLFFVIFNYVFKKRLARYYNKLNVFDIEVGYRPKVGNGTIRNVVQTVFTVTYMLVIFILLYVSDLEIVIGILIPAIISHIIELHFYGHLLSLLVPRLRLINYYMEVSLWSNDDIHMACLRNYINKKLCSMEKLMRLYHIVIEAYSYLIEAIKWQLLVSLIVTFINSLCACYHVVFRMIRGLDTMPFFLLFLGSCLGLMIPLFAPCTFGDQVHGEVRRLRELLASRLYANNLDKRSRGVARALLEWTETRDLSFTLMRMLDINISLPFKFVGLLITYLIILLQFEKVINPT